MRKLLSKIMLMIVLASCTTISHANINGDIWYDMPVGQKLAYLWGLEIGYDIGVVRAVSVDCLTIKRAGGVLLFEESDDPLTDTVISGITGHEKVDLARCHEEKYRVLEAGRLGRLWHGLNIEQMAERIDHIYKNPLNKQLYVFDVINAINKISNGQSQQEVIQAARKRHQESLE